MAETKKKYTLHLGAESITRLDILSQSLRQQVEDGTVEKLEAKLDEVKHLDAYYVVSKEKTPKWMETLSLTFKLPGLKRRSPAAVIVFEESNRVFAVTFGYGSSLLNDHSIEADFGVRVAINAVADTALKAVQKSNLASAIQQFAQSAFKSRFGSFGGQSKFEILRRVSGPVEGDDEMDGLVGASGVSLTTTLPLSKIADIARKALEYYKSDAYKKTAFSVVDDLKPILSPKEIDRLNALLVANLQGDPSSFELCLPQLNPDFNGYVKMQGVGLRDEYPDIDLSMYKATFESPQDIAFDDLKTDTITLYNDEHDVSGRWSVFRCLIGSLEDASGTRYVLNEGRWYAPSASVITVVEEYFNTRHMAADPALAPFNIVQWKKEVGKKGKIRDVPVYEREEDYNARVAQDAGYVLFDQQWHKADDGTFDRLEMCDLYDPDNLRMIHVKRTSRQPAMVSYLFEQGQRGADLWLRDDVRLQFIERVRDVAGDKAAEKLSVAQPGDITIECVIADYVNAAGKHTIPFLGKLSFESKGREIESRGFKSGIRFIALDKPKALNKPKKKKP